MTLTAREVHLAARPAGMPSLADFSFTEQPLPAVGKGQLLVKTSLMSVDPYMRGRMFDRPSYIEPFKVGHPLEGAAIGKVETSEHPDFAPGDVVTHFAGWRDHAVVDASTAAKINLKDAPEEAWLGPLGVPGFTAYVGLHRFAEVKEGDTVFVSAGAGAVGSMAVQMAKIAGARVIASAGSDDKTGWLRDGLGADEVINYRKAANLSEALRSAAPKGIDVYYDNVGGAHFEAALDNANDFARFVICGMIADYNGDAKPGPSNLARIVIKSLKVQGFIILNHYDLYPEFQEKMIGWLAEGRIKSRDTLVEGLEKAPQAFIDLFSGGNTGKMLVKIE